MAKIRGVKNPMPKAGGKPTNIFSTNGRQKNPSLGSAYKPGMTGAKYRHTRKDPVARDNGLK
jgi:hypothetical protein